MGIAQAEKEPCFCAIVEAYVNPFSSAINFVLNGWIA